MMNAYASSLSYTYVKATSKRRVTTVGTIFSVERVDTWVHLREVIHH